MSIVRIGCFEEHNRVSTNGTGFITNYKKRTFLITCRHVIEKCTSNQYFFIHETTNRCIPQNYKLYIRLEGVHFSEDDSKFESSDIAVFCLDDLIYNRYRKKALDISDLELNGTYNTFAYGFPNNYILSHVNYPEEILPPFEQSCKYSYQYNLSMLNQKNVPYRVKNVRGAIVDNCIYDDISGMSGGPLIDRNTRTVLGMIAFGALDGSVTMGDKKTPILGIIPKSELVKVLEEIMQ